MGFCAGFGFTGSFQKSSSVAGFGAGAPGLCSGVLAIMRSLDAAA